MEHISTNGIGGASTTGDIPIHNIRFCEVNDVGSGNGTKDADDSIFSSSSFSYWVRTTNQMK